MIDIESLIKEAQIKLDSADVRWWSWPEVFASTAGPRGGIGCAAITTYQVYAFESRSTLFHVKYCGGVWKEWDGKMRGRW